MKHVFPAFSIPIGANMFSETRAYPSFIYHVFVATAKPMQVKYTPTSSSKKILHNISYNKNFPENTILLLYFVHNHAQLSVCLQTHYGLFLDIFAKKTSILCLVISSIQAEPVSVLAQHKMLPKSRKLSSSPKKFAKQLVYGTLNFKGVMREHNPISNKKNKPFEHQIKSVKNWIERKKSYRQFILMNHDMGSGKSALLMQLYAAHARDEETKIKMILSVPAITLEQWRNTIAGWLSIKSERVLVTNNSKEITHENIHNKSIVVISHSVIVLLFKKSYTNTNPYSKIHGSWYPKDDLVPPFDQTWDLLCIDEAHKCANTRSALCNAHAQLSQKCKQRILMTGTACLNKPSDIAGIAKAGNAISVEHDLHYQNVKSWRIKQSSTTTVNTDTVVKWRDEFVDRYEMQNEDMQLPLLEHVPVHFDALFNFEEYKEYEAILNEANQLRSYRNLDRTNNELILMQAVVKMSQFLVSPLLARLGAKKFEGSEQNLKDSIKNPSDSLLALYKQIRHLRKAGHIKCIVASASVASITIAAYGMKKSTEYNFGEVFMFTGKQSHQDREMSKTRFLESKKAVMFLSIGAGSTGLHLVPGCECMILWGMSSYTPAIIDQCVSRIYRVGQMAPLTGKITIVHLLSYGSADFAVASLHKDKERLIKLIQGGDSSEFKRKNNSTWKHSERLVDECSPLKMVQIRDEEKHHIYNFFSKHMITAMAMGMHFRIGRLCKFNNIDDDVLRLIISKCSSYKFYTFPLKPDNVRLIYKF
jgi:hypothetical protein